LVYSRPEGIEQVAGWSQSWLVFAGYAAVIAVLFLLIFKDNDRKAQKAEAAQ
jgi:NHS family xanthosine MFS transporter